MSIGSSEEGRKVLFSAEFYGVKSLSTGISTLKKSEQLIPALEFYRNYVSYVSDHLENSENFQFAMDCASVISPLSELFLQNQEMLKFHLLSTLLTVFSSIKVSNNNSKKILRKF